MKQLLTRGIVLSRTDYGEADRILTIVTPEQGKLRLMARGVRKARSKLAGGIELFSVSDITYIVGRGEIGTLISSRLHKYYSHIVQDIDRVQLGYELIRLFNKATEDQPEAEYFDLLEQAFAALDDAEIDKDLIHAWFFAQLLKQAGHSPNLTTDAIDQKLQAEATYTFDFDTMAFTPGPSGKFTANHIKFLRLLFSQHQPKSITRVQGIADLLSSSLPLVRNMAQTYLRTV